MEQKHAQKVLFTNFYCLTNQLFYNFESKSFCMLGAVIRCLERELEALGPKPAKPLKKIDMRRF
jgi:hypothetical protein